MGPRVSGACFLPKKRARLRSVASSNPLLDFVMARKTSVSRLIFNRRKFFMESLEPRAMLAGNVDVFVSGGTLFVRGDNADNIVLIQDEGGGTYSVLGLDAADLDLTDDGFAAGPTLINGDDDIVGVP